MKKPIQSVQRATVLGLFALLANSADATLVSQLGILDLSANSGINPATGAAWQAGDTYRLAFVTSTTIDATSTDINTYNTFVQSAANNSSAFGNLGSVNWKAIASTASVNAMANTGSNPAVDGTGEAVFLLNGTSIFAANYTDLWDSANNSPTIRINRTENGDTRAGNYPGTSIWTSWTAVWTGTNNNGSTNTKPMGNLNGVRHGLMNAENNFWLTRADADGALNSLPMYALSAVLTVMDDNPFDPADLDQDGDVDDADFGIAFAAFTGPGGSSNSPADLDDDGDVDDADFGIAFAAFTGPGGGAASVPEPASLTLLGLGGLMVARRRRA